MNRIDKLFETRPDSKYFVPYVTAGHPGKDETLEVLDCLVDVGADIIELGFPFSDPTADISVVGNEKQQFLEDYCPGSSSSRLQRCRNTSPCQR